MGITSLWIISVLYICDIEGFLFDKKVCYQNVGCFKNEEPFKNTFGELPDSPDKIQARAYLWTRDNPSVPQELHYLNLTSISSSNFRPDRPTKLMIHGYMSSMISAPIIANLSGPFLHLGDFNVIGIDWSPGAKTIYPKAVANTRVAAAVVSILVITLKDKFGLKLHDLHVLGHSLGAHISGYIGSTIPGIARITGMDPAGPLFTGTDPMVRLDPSDALFVDVIHTDAVPIQDAGFGTQQALGHVDFYPNGGLTQPGCPPPVSATAEELLTGQFADAFNSVSCSHDRAIWYFIESVMDATSGCQFYATPCANWAEFTAGACSPCHGPECRVMGINAKQGQGTRKYFLKTNTVSPFCVGD